MKKNKVLLFVVFAFLSLNAQSIDTTKINDFILKVRDQLKLQTGLSVGVVIGDQKEFVKGYGLSNIEQEIPTTADSPFYIASATKSFTATLVELLSEIDTVDIDKPISHYLPELKFEDENLNNDLITIRDLLTHRSGILSIPSVIRTAYTGQHSFAKLIEVYNSAKFTTPEFKYTNDGYVLVSLILDKIYGQTWQQLMMEKIFSPLSMTNTSCMISDYDPALLNAYNTKNGEVEELGFLKADNTMHAAGGIVSTADDLSNWLIMNLNEGKFNEKEILSKKKMSEIHSSQEGCNAEFWAYKRYAYGLGWYLSDYNNELLIHHFGGYAGARSHISFMPEHNIGVTALTNDDGDGFYVVDLVADYIYNLYLGKDADSIADEELQTIIDKINKNKNEENPADADDEEVKSKYDIASILGNYKSDEYGEIAINNSGKLMLEFGNLSGELVPISESKFIVDLTAFKVKAEFIGENEKISELILYGPTQLKFTKK